MADAPSTTTRSRFLGVFAVLTIALASAAVGHWVQQRGFFHSLDHKAYDLCFRLTPYVPERLAPRHTPAAITIVWIDKATAEMLGKPRMLWPAELGEMLRAAAAGGAKVVGLDYSFDYPVTGWDESADPLFFQAYTQVTQQGVPVILAHDFGQRSYVGTTVVPVYNQALADGNIGFPSFTSDDDGIVREVGQIALQEPQHLWLTFAAKISATVLGSTPGDANPRAAIRYYKAGHAAFPSVSLAEVLRTARAGDERKLRGWFKGQIVLIGPNDPPERTPNGAMPGVEVQAHLISTLVQRDSLLPADRKIQWILLIVAALLATLAAYALRWYVSLPLGLVIAAAAFAVVLVGHARGIVLQTVPVELTILLSTVVACGARSLSRDRRNDVVADAFEGRISPDVWNSVLAAETPPLDGELREVTVMLCNVRGFSIHSEGRDPQSVMRELNEYFDQMSECILRGGGMVQQYSGDRVLALFGTPARYHDHARRAVVCAMEMLTRMDLLNERRTGAGLEQWRIGIGIHTGELMLGFVGNREKRLEYAANGEALAMTSRVESRNKEFGTQILLTATTRDRMGLDIATSFKGVLENDEGSEEGLYTV
jgi:class 3 adenylate cyclase/CHASE2 domain-containing sensor protein